MYFFFILWFIKDIIIIRNKFGGGATGKKDRWTWVVRFVNWIKKNQNFLRVVMIRMIPVPGSTKARSQ